MENKSINLTIETVTPVSVGTGEIWSPVTDFFVEGKYLYQIDNEKFQKLLVEKDKVKFFIDYVSKSVNESHTGTNADLKGFIENVLETPSEALIREKIPFPNADRSKTQASRCYTSNNRPVIPGSTLKGAIKTALFYDWLKKSDEGKTVLQKMNNVLLTSGKQNLFDKQYEYAKSQFLDKKDENEKPVFSDLSIGDTELFPAESLAIYKTDRIHLVNSQKRNTPQVKMCIEKGFSSALTFKSERWPFNGAFVKKINNFAYNAILTEQEILNDESVRIQKILSEQLSEYYDELMDMIEQGEKSDKPEFYIRVGSGKSYFNNTMAMAIYESNKEAFKALRELYELGKSPNSNKHGKSPNSRDKNFRPKEPFPITRTIISGWVRPLGWVKFSLQH